MYRVLLVQPERLFLTMFSRELRNNGYEVFAADNAEGAMDCVRAVQPEIVICNFWVRPSQNELAMIQAIREADADVPIVVVLREHVLACVAELMDNGASLVVARSLGGHQMAALVDRIAHALQKRRAIADSEAVEANVGVADAAWSPAFHVNAI